MTPLNEMKKIPAHFYKYVTMAHNSIDALRLLNIVKTEEQRASNILFQQSFQGVVVVYTLL